MIGDVDGSDFGRQLNHDSAFAKAYAEGTHKRDYWKTTVSR